MTPELALAKAITMAGGPKMLSKVLGIKSQAISQWETCPIRRVIALEGAVQGRVTRYQLRPDIYGPAPNFNK